MTPYIWQQRSRSTLAQVMVCFAWRHQTITWTNVDWSSVESSDIHIRAISLKMPQPITKICLKITCLKFHSSFPGFNKLRHLQSSKLLPLLYRISMMTSSNGNIFRVTGPLCGEFTGPGEFPTQRPVTRSFDVFLDMRLNKSMSKQWWGWWFETPSWSLWRQCNARLLFLILILTWILKYRCISVLADDSHCSATHTRNSRRF